MSDYQKPERETPSPSVRIPVPSPVTITVQGARMTFTPDYTRRDIDDLVRDAERVLRRIVEETDAAGMVSVSALKPATDAMLERLAIYQIQSASADGGGVIA